MWDSPYRNRRLFVSAILFAVVFTVAYMGGAIIHGGM